MSKLWWCWVAAGLSALGCADDPASGGGNSGATAPNVAGTKGDGSDNGVTEPARPGRGSVTLLASNLLVHAGTWTFSGPAEGAADGEDTVSCSVSTQGAQPTLVVSASVAAAEAPAAEFSLQLLEAKPTAGALVYDASSTLGLDVDVAFRQPSSLPVYSYSKGQDAAAIPPVSSSCSVTISELSDHWATGQVACRNLLAGQASADAALPDGSRGRASATIAFDCPIRAYSAPLPGTGGSESVAGTGGSSFAGTDSGGSASGGTPGSGGSLGVGGSVEPAKSCHGFVQSCSSTSYANCSSVQGCSTSGECGGISSGCYGYSQYSCSGQQGCVWFSASKYCSGSAWSCSLFHGSGSCISQDGCHWDDTCEGVSTPCSLLSEGTCKTQPGCTWD